MFTTHFELGLDHILDIEALDHILFVATLCGLYLWREWRKILILVTAFTIGHCATLILSSYDLVSISPPLVEQMIPVTIMVTGLYNIFVTWRYDGEDRSPRVHYVMALFFGLIHGLAFSSLFKSLLGHEMSITMPLLGFNLGVEVGQIIVVTAIMIVGYLLVKLFKLPARWWTTLVSAIAIVIAFFIFLNRM
jgi:hypothetical protein